MLSRHFAMNLLRNLALSPAGSFARRSAAFARSSFVGTWRCCWRFRIRNCLKASWSDGPVSRSASSWPLAAIRGAMGCGHWAAYERVRRGSRGAAKAVGRLWAAVRHRHRLPPGAGQIPNDASRAAAIAAIHGPSCRPQRLGRRLRSRTEASGRKALGIPSKLIKAGKARRNDGC